MQYIERVQPLQKTKLKYFPQGGFVPAKIYTNKKRFLILPLLTQFFKGYFGFIVQTHWN